MKDIKERIAVVEQVSASAHKRIDLHEHEIEKVRKVSHDNANLLHTHNAQLEVIPDAMKDFGKKVDMLTKVAWVAIGGGTVFIVVLGWLGIVIKAALEFVGK